MPSSFSIAAEGPGAGRAIEELFAGTGLVGQVQRPERTAVTRDGGALVVIAAVVGIVGGVAGVVTNVLDWRKRWLDGRKGAERLSVVIEDGRGRRILLNDATPEQIAAMLRGIAPPEADR